MSGVLLLRVHQVHGCRGRHRGLVVWGRVGGHEVGVGVGGGVGRAVMAMAMAGGVSVIVVVIVPPLSTRLRRLCFRRWLGGDVMSRQLLHHKPRPDVIPRERHDPFPLLPVPVPVLLFLYSGGRRPLNRDGDGLLRHRLRNRHCHRGKSRPLLHAKPNTHSHASSRRHHPRRQRDRQRLGRPLLYHDLLCRGCCCCWCCWCCWSFSCCCWAGDGECGCGPLDGDRRAGGRGERHVVGRLAVGQL
mmetsp:Transcript_28179/g.81172  ORF Transcript_28179/g.81172 Transcript_28179/m.81172 type:complete len:244 (-) Transcript_28179:533-1264(-)